MANLPIDRPLAQRFPIDAETLFDYTLLGDVGRDLVPYYTRARVATGNQTNVGKASARVIAKVYTALVGYSTLIKLSDSEKQVMNELTLDRCRCYLSLFSRLSIYLIYCLAAIVRAS